MNRITASAGLATVVVALAAPAATASADFTGSRAGSRVSGVVSITSQKVVVSGSVWDTAADGHCARLRGNWDIPWAPDHGFEVAEACGKGTNFYGWEERGIYSNARDFEVRTLTGDDYKVVWEGRNKDA